MIGRRLGVACLVVGSVLASTGCSRAPSRDGLVAKLQHRNGLTSSQAKCIANGLYDGVPDAQPAIRRLSTAELRAVAKPDNAGKVSAEVLQILRDVTTRCVPNTPSTTTVP